MSADAIDTTQSRQRTSRALAFYIGRMMVNLPAMRKVCPTCKHVIEITTSRRPIVVTCPSCKKRYKISS